MLKSHFIGLCFVDELHFQVMSFQLSGFRLSVLLTIVIAISMVTVLTNILHGRPRRWSIFQSDGMVNVFFQATIDFNGFSMVLIPLDHHH